MMPRDAAAALRAVAALRALCFALPHLPTPVETERLGRFEALMAAPGSATDADVEALAAGWRRWWREGRTDRLVRMARELPVGLVERDRRLASFVLAARRA